MDIVGRLFATVIVVVGLFFGSAVFTANFNDEITQERVEAIAVEFTSEVRQQGKITQAMYDTFINELDATGLAYDIDMVYTKTVIGPSETVGSVVETQESYYTQDIVNGIYSDEDSGGAEIDSDADGTVCFNQGDYFSLTLTNRDKTIYQKLLGMMLIDVSGSRIEVHCGGEIRDENW